MLDSLMIQPKDVGLNNIYLNIIQHMEVACRQMY